MFTHRHLPKAVVLGLVGPALLASLAGTYFAWRPQATDPTDHVAEFSPTSTTENEPPAGSPWLRVYDFGTVKDAAPLQHRFQVMNDTPVTWTLERMKTTCSCAAAAVAGRPVQPGEVFEVAASYRPPAQEGKLLAKVFARFKEPEAPPLVFELRATTVHDFSVSPESITIDALARGRPAQRPIAVSNNSGRAWEGLDVAADASWLKVAVRSVTPPQSRQTYR
jgi:hypothetical protein